MKTSSLLADLKSMLAGAAIHQAATDDMPVSAGAMDRRQFRAAVRKRVNAADKLRRERLGLPKSLMQYCKRLGQDAQSVQSMRLKFPF